jgi:hypothetical protein
MKFQRLDELEPRRSVPSVQLVIGVSRKFGAKWGLMKRLRTLAAFFGCLAVLAAGLPAVASAPAPVATPVQTAASEPCTQCPDCDGTPCQPTAAGCVLGCVTAPPTLGVATVTPPATDTGKTAWPSRLATLNGLSPPPDPFPPRL